MGDHRKVEIAEFWLTAPRFLQQAGQSEPRYVTASPQLPVKVRLPAKIMRNGAEVDQPDDLHLKRVKVADQEPPPAPVDSHPGKGGRVKAAGADKVFSAPVEGGKVRAADQ